MLLPSNDACVLVQMSAKTLRDVPAYRRMSRHSFEGLAMSRIASVPQAVTAHLDQVPARQLESVQVQLIHSGRLILEQAGEQTEVRAGSLAVYDASRPFSFVYPEEFRTTIVQLPAHLLRPSRALFRPLSASSFGGEAANVQLLAALLSTADTSYETLGQSGKLALSRTLIDALRLVAGGPEGGLQTAGYNRGSLAAAARSLIATQLNDPTLSAVVLAARLHVSVRALHAAFEDEPETLGQSIRRMRLDAARMLLATSPTPVRSVAESVGYLDVTHFIRLFKGAEGLTPLQWRRRQLGGEWQKWE